MAIHLYKTSTPSTRNGTVDSQHHCGKGRNARGIITSRHRGEVISVYTVKSIFDGMKKTYMVES
ncbi:hypothetical protein ACS0TY_030750 [Phlomoides rotata]